MFTVNSIGSLLVWLHLYSTVGTGTLSRVGTMMDTNKPRTLPRFGRRNEKQGASVIQTFCNVACSVIVAIFL